MGTTSMIPATIPILSAMSSASKDINHNYKEVKHGVNFFDKINTLFLQYRSHF